MLSGVDSNTHFTVCCVLSGIDSNTHCVMYSMLSGVDSSKHFTVCCVLSGIDSNTHCVMYCMLSGVDSTLYSVMWMTVNKLKLNEDKTEQVTTMYQFSPNCFFQHLSSSRHLLLRS